VERVTVAALLHDIDKPLSQRDGLRHGELGARMLEQMGFGELAPPVDSHTIEAIRDERRYPRGWVSVIIWVADKHVAQAFMTLDERLDDMIVRYPAYHEDIRAARPHAHALEGEIAEVSGLSVDQLVERLRDAWSAGAATETANAKAAADGRGRQMGQA
jgi:HD domain